jgi:hypothetical protein
MDVLIGFAILAVCLALILSPGVIAAKKGRSFFGFLFLGFVISPLLAAIIAACAKPDYEAMRK